MEGMGHHNRVVGSRKLQKTVALYENTLRPDSLKCFGQAGFDLKVRTDHPMNIAGAGCPVSARVLGCLQSSVPTAQHQWPIAQQAADTTGFRVLPTRPIMAPGHLYRFPSLMFVEEAAKQRRFPDLRREA